MSDKNNTHLRYLVIGTGRSGTGFMSKLLSLNNIPCGHEEICGYPVERDCYIENIRNTQLKAESSWLAVPFLEDIGKHYPDIRYILIVRHPVNVIKSFVELDFFKDTNMGGALQLVKRTIPGIDKLNPVESSMKYYIEWHKMISRFLRTTNHTVIHLENIEYFKLRLFLKKPFIKKLDEVVNTKPKTNTISKGDLIKKIHESDMYTDFRQRAESYGYNV